MATQLYEAEQIITLAATDEISRDRMAVQSLIVRGTAAGAFEITLGNATLLVETSTSELTKQLLVDRSMNYIQLVSGPVGAILHVLLEQKR